MGVPKKRTSAQKRDSRRAHWKVTPPNVSNCSNCGEPVLAHHVCPSCGTYGGKQIVEVKQA
jgi:large subunit ribosomal protein L32